MAERPPAGLPGVLDLLTPERRDALRDEYARRVAAGEAEARIVAGLSLQHGIAPSFVRILVAGT
jgi:hypothetical protein